MALHGGEVALELPGFFECREDAEHIVFEDRVSRRCVNVVSWGRGVFNVSPVRVAKCAVGHLTDMGKKAPHMRFTLPRACEIEPSLIVRCNAIEMRDKDAGVAVIKVVRPPIRSRLCGRVPIHEITMLIEFGESWVTPAAGNSVTRPAVIPDSIGGKDSCIQRCFWQRDPRGGVYVVNESAAWVKVRIKVADDKSPHCAMGDRVLDLLPGRIRIIDRLPVA
jgi:hypothetical protein